MVFLPTAPMTEKIFALHDEVRPYLDQLVHQLHEAGVLTTPALRHAFATVPRHVFLSSYYERNRQARTLQWIHHTAPSPEDIEAWKQWLMTIYQNRVLVTQTQVDTRQNPTSSSSLPSVMARMLAMLDPAPGMRVLEIGTGTGYNAALLAHLVEDPTLVTSIEIDHNLAEQAQTTFTSLGAAITIHVGDGRDGYAPHAPYDRILATASALTIPLSWFEQLAPAGRLVMDLRGELAGGLLCLEKQADGTAQGVLHDPKRVAFMALRESPQLDAQSDTLPLGQMPLLQTLQVDTHVFAPSWFDAYSFRLFLQWHLPSARLLWKTTSTGSTETHLIDARTQSRLIWTPVATEQAWQIAAHGTYNLWDTLSTILADWHRLGAPGPERYRVQIDQAGTTRIFLVTSEEPHTILADWTLS